MPLVFAAAMGGNISLIGAPGNMIAQAGLQQAGLGSFGFFDYGLVGLPILIVGTIFYATIGKRFLPDAPSHQPDGALKVMMIIVMYHLGKMDCCNCINFDSCCYDSLKNNWA